MITDDIRWFDPRILKNVVMDLDALSNDPAGDLDPSKTLDINYLGRTRVARLSKEYDVKRYILASSCCILDEDPLTTYTKANSKAEQDILPLADSKFTVSSLRFATAYGHSGRMRFDLAMFLGLFKSPKIPVMKEGGQWRPFVHIKDVATAYMLVMMQSYDKKNGQIKFTSQRGLNRNI